MPTDLIELKIFNPYDIYLSRVNGDRFKYNQFHDKIKKLPERFQDFVFDTMPADFIKDRVSVPLSLNENQSKEAAKIVLELILADFYLGDVVNQIKQRIGIDDQKAKTIAGLIVAELFVPILDDLKKMHLEKFAKNMPSQPQQQSDDRTVDLRNNL